MPKLGLAEQHKAESDRHVLPDFYDILGQDTKVVNHCIHGASLMPQCLPLSSLVPHQEHPIGSHHVGQLMIKSLHHHIIF